MTTAVPELPEQRGESVGDDLAGMGSFFIDPQGAARRIFHKWFWVGPVIVVSIISIVVSVLMFPILQHVMEVMPMPADTTPERYQKGIAWAGTIQRVSMYATPLLIIGLNAIEAVIMLAMCSVLNVGAKFRSLFNLVSGCALISVLASIASIIILRAKGEISTMAEIRPPLGLDIFMPENTNKYALALVGYFSIFQIWWIVMMVLILSTAFRVSKAKAFAVVVPIIVLSIIFRLVSSAFQR